MPVIYGNMTGGGSLIGKTVEIVSDDGADLMGVVVDREQVLTATPNDVRTGCVCVTDDGIITGEKDIPAYHTTEISRYISNGSAFTVPLANLDLYDYTKLQAIICAFNTNIEDSVSADKISILNKVYDVGSTTELSTVIKDAENKQIDLGIINNSGHPCVMRILTYKVTD